MVLVRTSTARPGLFEVHHPLLLQFPDCIFSELNIAKKSGGCEVTLLSDGWRVVIAGLNLMP